MTNFPLEAIIFDFDGVILDSEPLHYQATCKALGNIGLSLSHDDFMADYIGLSDKEMFPIILRENNLQFTQEKIDAIVADKINQYADIIRTSKALPIIAGFDTYLTKVSQRTNKIAICSGSSRKEITTSIQNFKPEWLRTFFKTIITSDDVQLGKPSPEGYLLTANRLGVDPKNCLVIEDSPFGIAAAKAAGMYVIGLLTTHDDSQLQQADKIVKSYSEIN